MPDHCSFESSCLLLKHGRRPSRQAERAAAAGRVVPSAPGRAGEGLAPFRRTPFLGKTFDVGVMMRMAFVRPFFFFFSGHVPRRVFLWPCSKMSPLETRLTGVRCLADQLIYPACEPLFGPSGYAGTATLYLVATADGRFVSLSSRHGQRRVHPDPWKSISWLRVCKRRITQTNAPASTMVCFIVPSSLPPKNFSRAGDANDRQPASSGVGGRRGGGGWQQGHGSREPRGNSLTTGCH